MDRDRLRKMANRFTIFDIYVAKCNDGPCYFFSRYTTGRRDNTLKKRCIVELNGRYCVPHVNRYDAKTNRRLSIVLMRKAIYNARCSRA